MLLFRKTKKQNKLFAHCLDGTYRACGLFTLARDFGDLKKKETCFGCIFLPKKKNCNVRMCGLFADHSLCFVCFN
jgi:hypothetical protein